MCLCEGFLLKHMDGPQLTPLTFSFFLSGSLSLGPEDLIKSISFQIALLKTFVFLFDFSFRLLHWIILFILLDRNTGNFKANSFERASLESILLGPIPDQEQTFLFTFNTF